MEVSDLETRQVRRFDWLLGGTIFLLLALRACAFGLQYWPQLDDYIQYHNYATYFTFSQLQETVGVLASRPLAGLADYFLWAPMFGTMLIGVLIVSALYALAAVWMKGLLERYVPVGPVFLVVMALLPLGVEGTYWMSASTRVVMGLLCACLAAKLFGRWLDGGGLGWALAFLPAMALPFGFYEQSAVLAMTLVLGMGLLEFFKHRKRVLLALWALPAAGAYFAVTRLLAHGGVYAGRTKLMLPVSDYYWKTFLPDILGQVKTVFVQGNFYTLAKGFVRGMRQVLSGELLIFFLLAAVLSVLYGFLAVRGVRPEGRRGRPVLLALAIGALLAIAPVTPFLIIDNPWFSFRGAVTSFAGVALVCDGLVRLMWRKLPGRQVGPAVLAGLSALVFCVAGASEIGDYRDTYYNDQRAAQAAMAALIQDYPTGESAQGVRVGVLGLEPSYLPNQNFFWHEHIYGCTESDWAFYGLLESERGERIWPTVIPLPADPMYRAWNAEVNRPSGLDGMYFYDGAQMIPVRLEPVGENDYKVWSADGVWLGNIWEEADKTGYFRRPEQLS